MGYTHYMPLLRNNVEDELADAAESLVKASSAVICGPDGTGLPIINDNRIYLNGCAETDDECEPLDIVSSEFVEEHKQHYAGFSCTRFCKTQRRPYDEVVVAILVYAIAFRCEGWESISTDGDIYSWKDGIELYEREYGRLEEDEFADIVEHVGYPMVYIDNNWINWNECSPSVSITRANYDEFCHLYRLVSDGDITAQEMLEKLFESRLS